MEELEAASRSEEHVIPKWMQRDFGLQNRKLTLINGTLIPYKQLKLPCCRECNNVRLGQMEESFQHFIYKDWKGIDAVPDLLVMQWCAKVLFATLYKEHSLPLHRNDPSGERIWGNEVIDIYSDLHLFLQSLILPTEFQGTSTGLPASIFKFDIVWSSIIPMDEHFDIVSIANGRAIAVRIKSRGYIVVFDGGLQQLHPEPELTRVLGNRLDPMQFREIAGYVFDRAARCKVKHQYLSLFSKEQAIISQSGPYEGEKSAACVDPASMYENEDFHAFAGMIERLLLVELDDEMKHLQTYPSYLFHPDGKVKKSVITAEGRFVSV
jgi:hypothetical protein